MYQAGRYTEALEEGYRKALELEPNNAQYKEALEMAEARLSPADDSGIYTHPMPPPWTPTLYFHLVPHPEILHPIHPSQKSCRRCLVLVDDTSTLHVHLSPTRVGEKLGRLCLACCQQPLTVFVRTETILPYTHYAHTHSPSLSHAHTQLTLSPLSFLPFLLSSLRSFFFLASYSIFVCLLLHTPAYTRTHQQCRRSARSDE